MGVSLPPCLIYPEGDQNRISSGEAPVFSPASNFSVAQAFPELLQRARPFAGLQPLQSCGRRVEVNAMAGRSRLSPSMIWPIEHT